MCTLIYNLPNLSSKIFFFLKFFLLYKTKYTSNKNTLLKFQAGQL